MKRRILLNPGPVNISERVRNALAHPDLCHREKDYAEVQAEVCELLRELFVPGDNHAVVLLTGSGTAAVEASVATLVPPDGTVLVVNNGVYGERIAAIARAHGIRVREAKFGWDETVDPNKVDELAWDVSMIAMVHHETTTGRINPVEEVARSRKVPILVDSISGLGGEEIDVGSLDACVGAANKCIQGTPGVSFVLVRHELLEQASKQPPRSVYLNLAQYGEEKIPFTPAVQSVVAFREALRELREETIPKRIERYRSIASRFRQGFECCGLKFYVPPEARSNTMTTLYLPPGVTYHAVHDFMFEREFVIYRGQKALADRVFRVANMGWIPESEVDQFNQLLKEFLFTACARSS
ncbi:MAG: pyridoxal-phosphate-dependent aminotransferase family protein [Candidatus Methylomirabilales bacterium]